MTWLEQELLGATSPEHQAALRYEMGRLSEQLGQDDTAATHFVAAVETVNSFTLPVERLISLLEKRKALRQLEPLLTRQRRQAERAPARVHALLSSAWFALLQRGDARAAAEQLRAALLASPGDPAVLLSLELVLQQLGEPEQLAQCLLSRAEAVASPHYRALLVLDAAGQKAEAQRWAEAYDLIAGVLTQGGQATWKALEQLEDLGHLAGRADWFSYALETRASVLQEILAQPERAQAFGASPARVSTAHALDALLRSAESHHAEGRARACLSALNRAQTLEPNHPVVVRRLIEQALAAGYWETAEGFIRDEVGRGIQPSEVAAFWLAYARGKGGSSLTPDIALVHRALEADPGCWVAHAALLNHLSAEGSAEELADRLERIAHGVSGATSRARYWMLAAQIWVLEGGNVTRAQKALDAANAETPESDAVPRVARALAQAARDSRWYESALQALAPRLTDGREAAAVSLELARFALLEGREDDLPMLLGPLAGTADGKLLAHLIQAYGTTASEPSEDPHAALLALSGAVDDPDVGQALRAAAALRLLRADQAPLALETLTEWMKTDPGNPTAAGLLSGQLAALEQADDLSRILRTTARACSGASLQASLLIQAGLLAFQQGDTESAIGDLDAARQRGATCAWALADWCRRASEQAPWPRSAQDEELVWTLHRLVDGRAPLLPALAELRLALGKRADPRQSQLRAAAGLAIMIHAFADLSAVDDKQLDFFAALGPEAQRLRLAWVFLRSVRSRDTPPRVLEARAQAWAQAAAEPASTLIWLAAAEAVGDRAHEAEARRSLATLVDGKEAAELHASAALIEHWLGQTPDAVGSTTVAGRLTNLELAPPGSEPERRALALGEAAHDLHLVDDPLTALLVGYNQLASGDARLAVACFRLYANAFPDDPVGWEGLVACAGELGDPELLAEASAALGNTVVDPAQGAALLEQAADVLAGELTDPDAAETALTRALELDPSRATSIERLLVLLRERGDVGGVLSVAEHGLSTLTAPQSLNLLRWEQAKALRELGALEESLAACQRLLQVERDHSGALALAAEVCVTLDRPEQGIALLSELARSPRAPTEQRIQSGIAAFDLLEGPMQDSRGGLSLLVDLHRSGLTSPALRERLARSALAFGAWHEASQVLERLMVERDTIEAKAEAARLLLAIERDSLCRPERAAQAASVLLDCRPEDPEVMDLALSGDIPAATATPLARRLREALQDRLTSDPVDTDRWWRLLRLAEGTHDLELTELCRGALAVCGTPGQAPAGTSKQVLVRPARLLPEDWFVRLRATADQGTATQDFPVVGNALAEALDTARPRVSERELSHTIDRAVVAEVRAWIGVLQLGEVALMTSLSEPSRVRLLQKEVPTLLLGSALAAPLGPLAVADLMRAAYAIRRRVTSALTPSPDTVVSVFEGLSALGDGPKPPRGSSAEALMSEFKKHLGRRQRKRLLEALRGSRLAPEQARAATQAIALTMDRLAAVITGDPRTVLLSAGLPSPNALSRAGVFDQERARRLLSFMVSALYRELRQAWQEGSA